MSSIGELAGYDTYELWDDLPCIAGASQVCSIPKRSIIADATGVRLDQTGDHELTLCVRSRSTAGQQIAEAMVLRCWRNDGVAEDWDLRGGAVTNISGKRTTWTAKPILQRLASTPWVSQTYANGLVAYAYGYTNATPSTILTDIVAFLQLSAVGYPYIALGQIDPTQLLSSFTISYTNALAVIRALEEATNCMAWLRVNGTSGYFLDLLDPTNGTEEPVDLMLDAQLLQLTRKRDIIESASTINVVGLTKGDGTPGTIGDAAWEVSAISGLDVDIVDPLGGPGPVQFLDEFTGLYAGPITSTLISAAVTLCDMSAYSTVGMRLRVPSVVGFTAGQQAFVSSTAYPAVIFRATITSVDAINNDLYFLTIPMPYAGSASNPPTFSPPLQSLITGGTVAIPPTPGRAVVTASSRTSNTTSRVTLASVGSLAVGDRLDFAADAAGTPIVGVTNPAAVALFGGKTTPPRPRVLTISTPTHHGLRNLAPAPLGAPWPAGQTLPTGWNATGSSMQVVPDTTNLLPGQTVAPRVRPSTTGQTLVMDIHSNQIHIAPRPGGDYLVLKLVMFVNSLWDQAGIDLFFGQRILSGSVNVIQPISGSLVHATGVPAPGSPTTGSGVQFANNTQCVMTTAPIDASQFYQTGVCIGIKGVTPANPIANAIDLTLQGWALVRGTWMPEGIWIESDSIAMVQEANRQLAYRSSPIDDLTLTAIDYYSSAPTLHPFSQLKPGRQVRLNGAGLGVSDLIAQITTLSRMGPTRKNASLTVSTKPQKLAALFNGNAGSGGTPPGGVGGGPPVTTPPTTNPTPTPPGGGGGSGSIYAGPVPITFVAGTEFWRISPTPSLETEPSLAVHQGPSLSYFNGGQLVVTGGASGAPTGTIAKIKWSDDAGVTWNALDGVNGPSLDVSGMSAGQVRRSASVTFSTAARNATNPILGMFFEGGDDATDATFGAIVMFATASSTPGTPSGPYVPPPPITAFPPQFAGKPMLRYYRSDLGVTAASGVVSFMDEQMHGVYPAAQTNGTKKPALIANALGTMPSIEFDGVDDELIVDLADLFSGAYNSGSFTLFLVCRRRSASDRAFVGSSFAGPPSLNSFTLGWSADATLYEDQGSFGFTSSAATPGYAAHPSRVTCLCFRSGAMPEYGTLYTGREFRSMGSIVDHTSSATTGGGCGGVPPLGRFGSSWAGRTSGEFFLFAGYAGTLTPTECATFETWLQAVYNNALEAIDAP